MKTITKEKAFEIMRESNGGIFRVSFVKKNGERRDMNCRIGVKKGVKGVGLKFNPADKGLFVVYDLQKQEFRMVNLNTIYELVAEKQHYRIGG